MSYALRIIVEDVQLEFSPNVSRQVRDLSLSFFFVLLYSTSFASLFHMHGNHLPHCGLLLSPVTLVCKNMRDPNLTFLCALGCERTMVTRFDT